MNIIINDLLVNRLELDNFLDDLFLNANQVGLEDVILNNLILRKDKPSDFPSRWDKDYKEDELNDNDILIV